MSYFYIVVFLVGVFYTFASLIISGITGGLHSHGDIGTGVEGHLGHHVHVDTGDVGHSGHADVGNAGHSGHAQIEVEHLGHSVDGNHIGNADGQHGHTNVDNSGLSHSVLSWFAIILNPLVAVSFLTVFGGIGIMGTNLFKWNIIVVFLVALASGIFVSTILYNFVAKPIYASENTSDVSREDLIGTFAEVSTDILANGFGTIKYTVNSIMYTAPARHIEEKAVKQGEKVFICKIEDNTFFISEVSSILN